LTESPVSRNASILLIGTSFRTSPISFREEIAKAFSSSRYGTLIRELPGATESALLITCNRVEVTYVTPSPQMTRDAFLDLVESLSGKARRRKFYVLEGMEAIQHTFRVASGLDSLALGEEQILQQVEKMSVSERLSRNAKAVLTALFDTAVQVGERSRKMYDGNQVDRSASSLAVRIAKRILRRMPKRILLIGTGRMIQLAAAELESQGSEVFIATKRRASRIRGRVVKYTEIGRVANKCDLIISATNKRGFVVTGEGLERRPRLIVDLGFPRNIDPGVRKVKGTRLLDLDDLAKGSSFAEDHPTPSTALERMISDESEKFERRIIATRLTGLLPGLYRRAEEVRTSELESARRRLGPLPEREARVVEILSRRIVSKLLAPVTNFLRSSNTTQEQLRRIELVNDIFSANGPSESRSPKKEI